MKSSHHIYKSLKCPNSVKGQWFVYLLECFGGSLYCGSTNDLVKRLKEHNDGNGAKYTRARLPVKLVYFESCGSRSSALKSEHEIKSLSRKRKINLIVVK